MTKVVEVCESVFPNLRLSYGQHFSVPGFRIAAQHAPSLQCFPPLGETVDEWFNRAEAMVRDAVEHRRHLPIYRIGHGEMWFITGYRPRVALRQFPRYLLSKIYRTVLNLSWFYSGTPSYGYETYRFWRIPRLRRELANYLRHIAEQGIMCLYLSNVDSIDNFQLHRFLVWCNNNKILLDKNNYSHVYFIYQILLGPISGHIIYGRVVGIVSSFEGEKCERLKAALEAMGARRVVLGSVSRNSALESVVDGARFECCELVLVGAGVGAAKVIWDLRAVQCPIIDAGFALDVMIDRSMGKQRVFCVSDVDWPERFGAETPPWADKFSIG